MSAADRSVLAPDLAGTVAYANVDPTLEGRALQDALRRAIATRRSYCSWSVDHAGWVVTLSSPERRLFYGRTLEEALAWCLVWLMVSELGIGHPKGLDWGHELGSDRLSLDEKINVVRMRDKPTI